MSREYTLEEKLAYVEEFENSGMKQSQFAREKQIPETTFRGWLRLERAMAFGEINLNQTINTTQSNTMLATRSIRKPIVFANNDIRIELKEGYNKEFLKRIVEVLINDN